MSVRTQDEILRFPDQGDNTLTPNQHNYVWNDDDTGCLLYTSPSPRDS